MAEVYLASAIGPEGFAKDVVIKVVRSFLSSDQQFIDMFVAEARLSSRLNHANVVQIFDFGKAADSYYLAMEYVRGASLWDLRKRCRELGVLFPSTLAAEIGSQVARGLQYAHSLTDRGQPLGIVHRDVTPHNVLLSFDGAVKLTDFGIAKAGTTQTAPGILKGKFAYMSPEQARGEQVDARSDVFAMGIVIWELLTGGRLFDADSELGVLRAVQSAAITPPGRLNPDVPDELSEIVLKALARPLDERFQTAFELERALGTFVLRHAKTLEDSSSSLFLRQMFREEYEAVNQALGEHDPAAHGQTLAVKRDHQPSAESPVRHASANETTQPPQTLEEVEQPALGPASVRTTAQMPGVRLPSPSQRLKPLPEQADGPGDRPKTDVMPANRVSRKLPSADEVALVSDSRSAEVTEPPDGPKEPGPGRARGAEVSAAAGEAGDEPKKPLRKSRKLPVIEEGARRPQPAGDPGAEGVQRASSAAVTLDEDAPARASRRGLVVSDVAAELPRRTLGPLVGVVVTLAALAGAGAWWLSVQGPALTTEARGAMTVRRDPEPVGAPPLPAVLPDAGDETDAGDEPDATPEVTVVDSGSAPADAPPAPKVPKASSAVDAGSRSAPVLVTAPVELRAVPYATVTIDGRLLGDVEGVRMIRLSVGGHDLVFTHPRLTRRDHVVVKPGQTTVVVFDARSK